MKKIWVLLAALLAWPTVAVVVAQAPTDADVTPKRCLTDEVGSALRASYPKGVPGRNLPAPSKVERVGEDFIYYIPVVVHVMHAFGPEMNVTPFQIESQINVLNETFGRYASGFNDNPLGAASHVRFCLAQFDPDGNPTLGYEYIPSQYAIDLDPYVEDTFMKRYTIWDPKRYMNIWTVREIYTGYFEGYAYLPEEVAGTVWDGIVVDHSSFGLFPAGTAGTLGKTITHEAGHYLGLYHPWGTEELTCGEEGTDYCDDTPPVPEIYYSHVPACDQPLACDGTPRQVANYMDYADDGCQNMYTQCQVDRMFDNLLTYRAEMVGASNLLATGCAAIDSIPAQGSIYVYPVPATTYMMLNIDVADVGPAKIEIVDMAGRKVYKALNASSGRGVVAIDVSQFSQGIYMLHVWTNKAELHRRILIGY